MRRVIAAKIAILILLGILTATHSVNAAEADKPHDGYWWECVGFHKAILGEERCSMAQLSYISGYLDGVYQGLITIKIMEIKTKDEDEKRLYQSILESNDFGKITLGQLQQGLMEFYSDFRNKQMVVMKAIHIVRADITGAKKEYIECWKEADRLSSQGKVEESIKRFEQCKDKK